MARFLFLTWGGAGNQSPAIGLAAALAGRGHVVTFAGYPDHARRFDALGFGAGWRSPWPAGDPRPLAVVSFSTGQAWDQRSRIQRTLDALDDGGYRVLVTTGLAGTPGITVPGDAALVPFVPHASVLPHAAITVTHAGHGTVAASLAHGVPLVALPNLAADQPALAQRVAELRAGIALDGDSASVGEIAAACRRVLADDDYAKGACRMQEVIAAYPGGGGADRLEAAITASSRPLTRRTGQSRN